jgi:hypothetical protein
MFQVHHVVRLLDKSVAEHTELERTRYRLTGRDRSHVTETDFFIRFMARVLRNLASTSFHTASSVTGRHNILRRIPEIQVGVSYIEPRRRQSRHTAFMDNLYDLDSPTLIDQAATTVDRE